MIQGWLGCFGRIWWKLSLRRKCFVVAGVPSFFLLAMFAGHTSERHSIEACAMAGLSGGLVVATLFLTGVAKRVENLERSAMLLALPSVESLVAKRKAEEQTRLALREKEVLVREIHHRVKNNLQIISSLLSLQAAYVKDKAALEILRESQNRVRAMAIVHEQLHRAKNLSTIDFFEYLRNLAGGLFRSYGVDPQIVSLKLDVEKVMLNIDTAIPCGLITHELISNSLKHAFPGGRKGRIQVALHNEAGTFRLTVKDNGVGFSEAPAGRGKPLGSRLVNILAEQIEGAVKRKRSRTGTEYEVRFREMQPREVE